MSEWKVIKAQKRKLLDDLLIRETDKKQYDKLKKFHYISYSAPPVIQKVFGIYHKDNPDIIYGIIIYSAPILELGARKKTILNQILTKFPKVKRYQLLNKNVGYFSRVVIHPSIRGIGSSSWLIENTWRKINRRFVESMGVMLYFYNFLPKSYSYFVKYERALSSEDFFDYKSPKGQTIHRAKSPIIRYGYGLFINEKEPFRF